VLNRQEHEGPGYTGHEEDSETGLTNMQQRYALKVIGRMISTDPVDVDPNTGANFNRYAYANDNPYRYVDPDGRCTGSHISNSDGTCASTGSYTTNVGAEPLAMAQKRVNAASGALSQAAAGGKVASSDEYTKHAPDVVSQVESDPAVQNWEDQAKHSDAFNARDERKRHEEGMWAYPAKNGSGVKVVNMPAAAMNPLTGMYSSIVAGAPPTEAGYSSPVAFHTHPFPFPDGRSVQAGYIFMAYPEPSQADVNYARSYGIDGVVISHSGNYYFGVSVPSN
jgi:RHS repeat-associated protein